MQKLSAAQQRVLGWIGKGWTAHPGSGSALMVDGQRICNVDTMMALYRQGLAKKDAQGCWNATPSGKSVTKQLGL